MPTPAPGLPPGGQSGLLPGLLAAAAAVVLALAYHALVPALLTMTLAVAFGLLAANVPGPAGWAAGPGRPGLDFAGKRLMRAGIVVLGLKISLVDVLGLGWGALLLITGVVLAAFAGTYGISRLFRLPPQVSLLIATGFAICGASAIGAMAAVRRIRQHDTVLPVALVTLCGTLAIGVLPLLIQPLALSPEVFGAWTGASVHDVGQVVATAQTAGASALAVAVVVKLTRVILLAPMVAAAGLHHRRRAGAWRRAEAAAHRSPVCAGIHRPGSPAHHGLALPDILDAAAVLQDLVLGMALFGLGSAVRVRHLLHTGLRALLAALASWVLIAALGLGAAFLMIR
ncbi:YeiH family protein [Pseudarthrobacter sp. So.54]